MMAPKTIAWSYLVYVLLFDGGLIFGCGYVVFWLDHSGWWFVLAIFICSAGLTPDKWADLWRSDRRPCEEEEP